MISTLEVVPLYGAVSVKSFQFIPPSVETCQSKVGAGDPPVNEPVKEILSFSQIVALSGSEETVGNVQVSTNAPAFPTPNGEKDDVVVVHLFELYVAATSFQAEPFQ